MRSTVVPLPSDELAAALRQQATSAEHMVASFAATAAADGLGLAMPRLLRDLVALCGSCDLARLPADCGRRIASVLDDNRPALNRDFGRTVGAREIEEGLAAAAALAGMIGCPWDELETIPRATLRARAARTAFLANTIENAALSAILDEPNRYDGAPAGVRLH